VVNIFISAILLAAGRIIGDHRDILNNLFQLAVFCPGFSVYIRRLHDTGRNGWSTFLIIIPIVGVIWLIVLMFLDSTPGENKYGPNPKGVLAK
jgi:uncharacterized membrane protein YhaH (DUF805 family)